MNREDRYHTTSWDAGEVRRQGRPEADRPLSDRLAPDRQAAERPEHSERSQQRPPAQNQVRSQKKRRQKPRTNPLLAFILWVVIVAASSTIFAGVGWLLADDFAALTKTYKEVNFEVSEDWIDHVETNEEGKEVTYYDMKKVAGALEEEGLVKYGWFFRLFCKFYHAERKVTQGTFALNTNMDYMALVRNMRSRGGAAVTVDVAIPEGYTVSQIIDLLVENEVGTKEALTETAGNYDFGDDYPFLNSDLKGNISRLEGYLFPDTYNFYVGGRPELVFNAMLSNFNTKVYGNEDLAPLFAESEYDLDEIITIASLIEKETDGGDRDKISSVIYNRLHNEGETNYLLQIDAALVYAAGRTITQDDYANLDSPYNLYTNQGLPPTPIANPGNASIRAALQPAETDYYFYVLGGDGKHVFSETLAQHNQAVADAQNQKQEGPMAERRTPELLAPAGDMERLHMAVLYGADAVYLAGESFGMRSFAGNFSPEELPRAVRFAHSRGVRVHVTVNTMPRNGEMEGLPAWLELLDAAGVDALIAADLGTFTLAGRYAPRCERHVSTQVSVANYECAAAWYDLGAKRVILARELSLEEIRTIRERTPADLELEAFVHGAMCVSYSGRCLLSNYMTGRDSNRGACAQPCRYQYYLMEEKRPGEFFPVFEDAWGTYIMNSRDMCMIDHIGELMDAGLTSLKIEGRAKSAYYAAIVTGAYRHAIDAAAAGEPLDPVWRDEVEHVSHRRYSTGFYFGQPGQYYENARYIREWQVIALVTACDEDGMALLSLRNKFSAGDEVELVGPDVEPFAFPAPVMEDAEGAPLTEPKNPQMVFKMQLPRPVPPYSILRIARDLSAKS